jgi:hypothetical protein
MLPFQFHTVTHYAAAIRIYGYHLLKSKFSCKNIRGTILQPREKDGVIDLLLGLSPGRFTISNELELEIVESEIFKAPGSGLAKWTDIYVTISANDLTEAERIFTKFITEATNFVKPVNDYQMAVQIYDPKGGWRFISNLPRRPMDTIYLDPIAKQKLLNDITAFIADEDDYVKFGIPYKRCYLFHGKIGSGKSSLIFALASLLKRNIAIFNFSVGVTDPMFISAISQLTSDKILVLEDLDALFVDRSPTETNNVSFSALLNVLDGVCRKSGLITFITSNHVDRIDPALLRPGRIDYIMEFTFAGKNQIKQMYDQFLPNQPHNFDEFYDIIEGKRINMSLIQKFLFEHRKDPNILKFEHELITLVIKHEEKDRIGIS